MGKIAHKILYALLPLGGYLRVVSGVLFLLQRIGWGRKSAALEYIYHLPKLINKGGVAIDIGANLGYYTRTLSRVVGESGKVHGVEPVPPIFEVLKHNTRHCRNVTLHNVALGESEATISMANDSISAGGYFGTGQNFVKESSAESVDIEFEAQMVRGSELFAELPKVDLIKCDIEGYEVVVINEIRSIIERHHPVVLIETGGENRVQMISIFTELGYQGFTLQDGREVPLSSESHKDIIFRY